jgi:hypothetical protein
MWTTYLGGWLIASVAAFVVADSFPHSRTAPPRGRGALAFAAGALWPVLLVGVLQMVGIALVANRMKTNQVEHFDTAM